MPVTWNEHNDSVLFCDIRDFCHHNSSIELLLQYFKPGVLRNPTFPSSLTRDTTQYLPVEKGTFFERVM